MVLINEWLANPTGLDTGGEWVELWNNSDTSVSLSGWALQNSKGQKFVLKNETISAQGYLVLRRSDTKLVLKNSDESLSLYNQAGKLLDASSFVGTAPEGKSYSRIGATNNFVFADPSPGAPNPVHTATLTQNTYPLGTLPGSTLGTVNVVMLAIGCGALLAALSLAAIKTHHELSKQFFGRN